MAIKGTSSTDERWFVSDAAITQPEADEFDHRDVAEQLAEIVLKIRAPATVGLIGPFGSGKSSIGNLLGGLLRGHKDVTFVSLSIEKHTGVERQRALVHGLAAELVASGIDRSRVEEKLEPLVRSSTSVRVDATDVPLKDLLSPRLLVKMALAFAIFYGLGVLVAALGNSATSAWKWPLVTGYQGIIWFAAAMAGFVSLLKPAVQGYLQSALKPAERTDATPRAEAADEIERVFENLAKLVKNRLVILVEDVDRLAPNEVLSALTAIKTFQDVPRSNPPIFVVACDEDVVIRAIKDADPSVSRVDGSELVAARAYLDKLFAVRQIVPPHFEQDMREFAERALDRDLSPHPGRAALGGRLTAVLDVLIHEGVSTPRHVVRLLNAFLADYRLAGKRERTGGRLSPGEVTGHPEFLARLVALRTDFPRVFIAVQEDYALLPALDNLVLGRTPNAIESEVLQRFLGTASPEPTDLDPTLLARDLRNFLARSARWVTLPEDLSPFIFLGQDTSGRVLGSSLANRVRSALVNGNSQDLLSVIRSVSEEVHPHIAAITSNVLRTARGGFDLGNTIDTAAGAIQAMPGQSRVLADHVAEAILRQPEPSANPAGVGAVIRAASDQYTDGLIDNLTRYRAEETKEARQERAQAIGALTSTYSSDARIPAALETQLTWLEENGGAADGELWLGELSKSTTPQRDVIFSPRCYLALTRLLSTSDDETARTRFCALLSESTPAATYEEILAEARTMLSAESESARELGLGVISSLQLTDKQKAQTTASVARFVETHYENHSSSDIVMGIDLISSWSPLYRSWTTGADPNKRSVASLVADAVVKVLSGDDVDEQLSCCRLLPRLAETEAAAGNVAAASALVCLNGHRTPGDVVGIELVTALLSANEYFAPAESQVLIGQLLAPITLRSPDEPEARFTLESLPHVFATAAGKRDAEALATSWQALLNQNSGDINLGTPMTALSIVFRLMPDVRASVGVTTFARIRDLSTAAPTPPVLKALSETEWPANLASEFGQHADRLWDSLAPEQRHQVLLHLVNCADDTQVTLAESLQERFVSLAEAEAALVSPAVLVGLSALVDPPRRLRIVELLGHVDPPSARTVLSAMPDADAVPLLLTTTDASLHSLLVGATPQIRHVATLAITRLLQQVDAGTDTSRAASLLDAIQDEEAQGLLAEAVSALDGTEPQAMLASLVVARLAVSHASAVPTSEITESVVRRLRNCSPDLARSLGAMFAGTSNSAELKDVLKELRKDGADQRAVAEAFEAGRKST